MKRSLTVVSMLAIVLFYAASSYAVQCGQRITGGTPQQNNVVYLDNNLNCTGTVGIIIDSNYVSFVCNGHSINNTVAKAGGVGIRITGHDVYVAGCTITGWRDSAVYANNSYNVQFIDGNNVYNNGTGVKYVNLTNSWVSFTKAFNNTGSGVSYSNTQGGGSYALETYGNSGNGLRLYNAISGVHNSVNLHNNVGYDMLFTGQYESVASKWNNSYGGIVHSLRFDNGANNNRLCNVTIGNVSHGNSTHHNYLDCQ